MPYTVEFKSCKKLPGNEKLCCWCYEITAKDENPHAKTIKIGGENVAVWGLDIDARVDIQDPLAFSDSGCARYDLGAYGIPGKQHWNEDTIRTHNHEPKGSKWVPNLPWPQGAEKLEICFIAPCEEDEKTPISLERGTYVQKPPTHAEEDGPQHETSGGNFRWEKVVYSGPKTMKGPKRSG